jgi:hypothetical protein
LEALPAVKYEAGEQDARGDLNCEDHFDSSLRRVDFSRLEPGELLVLRFIEVSFRAHVRGMLLPLKIYVNDVGVVPNAAHLKAALGEADLKTRERLRRLPLGNLGEALATVRVLKNFAHAVSFIAT